MCVHNCWFPSNLERYKFISYFFSRVMLVGERFFGPVFAPTTPRARREGKLFYGRGMRQIIENQYLSQSPLKIFSTFFCFKLQYSINLSYFFFSFSLFLILCPAVHILISPSPATKYHWNCHFFFHFDSKPWRWNFIFHNRNGENSLEKFSLLMEISFLFVCCWGPGECEI